MSTQLIIWERSTRLEAGLKRELNMQPNRPTIRVCRSAMQVLRKCDAASPAVLLLDESAVSRWVEDCDDPIVTLVRSVAWGSVIAVVPTVEKLDWRWTATGITAIQSNRIHDGRLAVCCQSALSRAALCRSDTSEIAS